MAKDKKKSLNDFGGIMFSTNPDFAFESGETQAEPELTAAQQQLRVTLDRKNRGGKSVTVVYGYRGTEERLQQLAKFLKSKCGVGGAVKDGEILIQGDFRDKVIQLLQQDGYGVKKSGG